MYNLDDNARFAGTHGYNLTGRLRHQQVVDLARRWLPEIRFHEKERFHPISLAALFDAPTEILAALPQATRDTLLLTRDTPAGPARFEPPLILASSGSVLGHGDTAREALVDPSLTDKSVYTHGANLNASQQLFGASDTLAGLPNPSPGDPRAPRHPIVVGAEMRMLLEVLKHELQLDERGGSALDAAWGRFKVESLFFLAFPPQPDVPFPSTAQRRVLRNLVAGQEIADPAARNAALITARAEIPFGWQLVERAWAAVTGYAFVEYALLYAYNDYASYQDLGNEHEGDVEGFCLVFERRMLDELADENRAVEAVVPHTIITAAHEELNDTDDLKRLPLDPDRAKKDLLVYVAVGSHGSYLTPGPHDVVDLEDILTDYPGKIPGWMWLLAPGLLLAGLLLFGLYEHFVDVEDETSDNGISIDSDPGEEGTAHFDKRVDVFPFSDIRANAGEGFDNIYEGDRGALALRAFPGLWGGHDGFIDHSAPWENKTARYFRKFLNNGDISLPIIL